MKTSEHPSRGEFLIKIIFQPWNLFVLAEFFVDFRFNLADTLRVTRTLPYSLQCMLDTIQKPIAHFQYLRSLGLSSFKTSRIWSERIRREDSWSGRRILSSGINFLKLIYRHHPRPAVLMTRSPGWCFQSHGFFNRNTHFGGNLFRERFPP